MNLKPAMAVVLSLLSLATPAAAPPSYEELIIEGETARNGVYDPCLEYGSDGVGWMSYSAVNGTGGGKVATAIARSDDFGKRWRKVADVNVPEPVSARLPNGQPFNGIWRHETSALVHDPGDQGREWKLFWHRYAAKSPSKGPQDRIFQLGWIAMRSAPSPHGPWTDETPLIGAGPFLLAPFETRFRIGELSREFDQYVVLTEPGVLRVEHRLYLSLQAVRHPKFGRNRHDVILISSDDHGKSWAAAGVVLRSEEAGKYGADWFTGTSLAAENGRVFLLVAPEIASAAEPRHLGTVAFEFADLAKGALKRDAGGDAIAVKRLAPTLSAGGQSDYDAQNVHGGVLMPQFDKNNWPKLFRIYKTGARLVSE